MSILRHLPFGLRANFFQRKYHCAEAKFRPLPDRKAHKFPLIVHDGIAAVSFIDIDINVGVGAKLEKVIAHPLSDGHRLAEKMIGVSAVMTKLFR